MNNPLHHISTVCATDIAYLPKHILLALISLYQHTVSPDHGPLKSLHPYGFCPHNPTCSMYAKQSISEKGCVWGSLLTMKRISSCHPWKKPDPQNMISLLTSSTE